MRTLAAWCFRNRIIVIAAWIATLIGLTAIHSAAGSAYSDNFKLPNTESFNAVRLLERNVPKQSGDTDQLVIAAKHGRLTDAANLAQIRQTLAFVARQPHVSQVSRATRISPDGKITFANVQFDIQPNKYGDNNAKAFVNKVTSRSTSDVEFELEGQIARQGNSNRGGNSLGFGFFAAAVVLFLVFGSLLATLLPLLAAGFALGSGIAVIGLTSHAINMASFSNQLALLIGLGVGVDYALFIVTRYRQGLLRGLSREDAVVESLDTSGRAILFAGLIVCIAMLGMFALGVSFLYGVAIAAVIAVAFTVAAALTLLPALLSLFGRLVLRRRERNAIKDGKLRTSDESPLWARWMDLMEQRPALFAGAAALVMVVIAIPFFGMRLGSADAGSDPTSTTTRKAYDLLAKGFGPGYNGPLQLVAQINSPAQRADFARVVQAAARTPGVVSVGRTTILPGVAGRPDVGLSELYPKGSPQANSTADLVHKLRSQVLPAVEKGTGLHVLTGGQTAIFDDFSHVLSAKLPLFIGVVVVLSFLLLMTVFRSLAIPITAALMNILSAGAAFGVVTAVFQHGWGASLLGIDKTGPIEAFLPVLMFPILFGLSMDYEVFLVSRIYEEWHRRGSTREAVTHGLAATGRTITAAAAIMVLVFGAFILGGQRVIELFGVGLASAVLLDAVFVRSVIVPGVMLLLGDTNWKLPQALDRILPHLRVEGRGANGGEAPAPAASRSEPVRSPA